MGSNPTPSALSGCTSRVSTHLGRVAEWLKAHDWKSCGVIPAWVRIPPRPLEEYVDGDVGVVEYDFFFAGMHRRCTGYGAWLSPVERCVRDAEVPGSNPGAPIEVQ